MKKILFIILAGTAGFVSCKKQDFADAYLDPSKVTQSTVEKQFSGFLTTNKDWVLPAYTNYFVSLRTTLTHYTQTVGWINAAAQYVPGEAGIAPRWNNYYSMLAQYREMEKILATLPADDQADKRIYKIAASIYLYDHTEKIIDLHGDIPFINACKLSANGGDYINSLATYDDAAALYTKMLDDLKGFSDELNTINVKAAILTGFKIQDFVNKGNLTTWKKYCNSLRLRMLARVSDYPALKSRATSETATILAAPATYPVVASNAENVQMKVYDISTGINSKGWQTGLEDWNGNIAGKVMIDHMKANSDPRLRAMFEPGASAGGVYTGLDPMLGSATQTNLIAGGTLAIYNRSTLTRNQFFPGVLINAAEVSFLTAEAYLNAGNGPAAKAAYNDGIAKSIDFYFSVRAISNNSVSPALVPYTAGEVTAYQTSAAVNWDNATTTAAKLALIATQKWIDFGVVLPYDNWAEQRRLDYPVFNFEVDNSNAQTKPPFRWFYASAEKIYNTANYQTVAAKDNLTTKIFWDVK